MAETDLDPQTFLLRMQELSNQRQQEDDERYEKLEAQIREDRAARMERKMERERSLSPVKRSGETTPNQDASLRRTPVDRASPVRELTREDSVRSIRSDRASPGPTDRSASPTKAASPSAAMPSRANTMSWQRRPQSGARSRPLSLLAAENATRNSGEASPEARPTSQDSPSQSDIARTLSSKDPAWFRQTPDRAIGSAAYRRQRDEESDTQVGVQRQHLPGLRESDGQEDDTRAQRASSPHQSSMAPVSPSRNSHLAPADQQSGSATSNARATTPEVERAAFGRTVPSLQNRGSMSNRPASPTKGSGGFVESAMMKRTDSVSKRWSNQPAGLGRQDSNASLKSPFGSIRNGMGSSHSMPRLEQSRRLPESPSRPGSLHDEVGKLPERDLSPSRQHGSFHSRSRSTASLRESATPSDIPPTFSPPLSPSKRFSPTKSSWLESALARPESPTKQMSPPSTQPSWMADLSKAKQQRNSVATLGSQDESIVELGTASVRSFQPLKASRAEVSSPAPNAISQEPSLKETPKRTFTPPTKAKPPSLAGKKSEEKLQHSQLSEISSSVALDPSANSPGTGLTRTSMAVSQPSTPSLSQKPNIRGSSVTDLRSSLKSRATSGDQAKAKEPEFRNALGNLKKTATKNYVAPDVLKDNILRGKAGLSITGGPQKTVRRDDFKESILQKKAEMKAKPPEPGMKPAQKAPSQAPTLEALQVRKGLSRSGSSALDVNQVNAKRDITPEAVARQKTLKAKPEEKPAVKPSRLSEKPAPAPFEKTSAQKAPSLVELKKTPSDENRLASERPEKEVPETVMPSSAGDSAPIIAKVKSNAFADRFNPALASVLARGPPPPSAPLSQDDSADSIAKQFSGLRSDVASPERPSQSSQSKELTHMTKDRARGPKRRRPKAAQDTAAINVARPEPQTPKVTAQKRFETSESTSREDPIKPKPKSTAVRTLSMNLSDKLNDASGASAKPSLVGDTTLSSVASSAAAPVKPASASASPLASDKTLTKPILTASGEAYPNRTTQPLTQSRAQMEQENKENTVGLPSVKDAATRWGKVEGAKSTTQRGQPIKLPSREDEEAALRSAGLLSSSPLRYQASKPDGLGITTGQMRGPKSPLSPPASAGMPPKPAKSSRVVSQSLGEVTPVKDESTATTPRAAARPQSDAERLLQQYFGEIPMITSRLELDAQSVLQGDPTASSGRTLRKSIQLMAENGKITPLPTEREYILFSSSLYFITHVFGNASGQRQTEVFLWAGADVPPAAIEDAQIFGKRVAKDAAVGSRTTPSVMVVRQGKEPASCFQALGGIVIIRKGSHADTATRPYMLCGRPHLGHIAFDEVDMSLDALSSAFPYIVVKPTTIQDTQVFLWKGQNCSPETIGSARLISMDLASSDVTEVTPGQEPPAFLSGFPKGSATNAQVTSGLHVSDKACPRLFRFEVRQPRRSSSSFFGLFGKRGSSPPRPGSSSARPTSSASNRSLTTPPTDGNDPSITISEISPFAQDDFEPENIYLMDCLQTVLIIPGPLLTKPGLQTGSSDNRTWEHLFAQACLFGNDYAVLAAGIQDRPRVPQVKIVLGDLGADEKMLFRSWDERRGLWGSAGLMAGQKTSAEGVLDVTEVLDCCAR